MNRATIPDTHRQHAEIERHIHDICWRNVTAPLTIVIEQAYSDMCLTHCDSGRVYELNVGQSLWKRDALGVWRVDKTAQNGGCELEVGLMVDEDEGQRVRAAIVKQMPYGGTAGKAAADNNDSASLRGWFGHNTVRAVL